MGEIRSLSGLSRTFIPGQLGFGDFVRNVRLTNESIQRTSPTDADIPLLANEG